MRRWVRPDGRSFVFGEPDEALPLGRSAQVGFAEFRPADAMATLDPAARVPLWRERLPRVAETDDGIVDFAHFGPHENEPVGEIYRFFVAPECWGKGVGQALMRRALEQLQALGFDEACGCTPTIDALDTSTRPEAGGQTVVYGGISAKEEEILG